MCIRDRLRFPPPPPFSWCHVWYQFCSNSAQVLQQRHAATPSYCSSWRHGLDPHPFNFTMILSHRTQGQWQKGVPIIVLWSNGLQVVVNENGFLFLMTTVLLVVYPHQWYQGLIELLKAVRGHAMHVDGKILNVTKNKCMWRILTEYACVYHLIVRVIFTYMFVMVCIL